MGGWVPKYDAFSSKFVVLKGSPLDWDRNCKIGTIATNWRGIVFRKHMVHTKNKRAKARRTRSHACAGYAQFEKV